MLRYPQHAALFRIPAIAIGDKVMISQNKLLGRYPGADGMKTGFICSSGFNIVASASRGSKRVVAVVLGQPNSELRNEIAARLIETGFGESSGFLKSGPTLETLRPEATPPSRPLDMKPHICGESRTAARARKAEGPPLLSAEAPPPVAVRVSIASAPAGTALGTESGDASGTYVPVPRQRPVPLSLLGTMADPAAPPRRP
ncbi:hypothetical protein [Methylobrevis pamukkalensis]|uniref:D-alanyl-D-alanine carboxypeptidase DacF n=1 Tax=Methylobrevis pamukkalensis TaxID=1439726 RepID=A0A1E3GZ77_9HYPH|nr:hypothetical protein [Methylobrevis pamukkalensis]ODN68611.1 D-alanyl-D-alanine carboxypeptidase DacF precursor [Methylobrevis pamukkalensis]